MECLPFWDFGNSPRGVAQLPYLGGVFISPGGRSAHFPLSSFGVCLRALLSLRVSPWFFEFHLFGVSPPHSLYWGGGLAIFLPPSPNWGEVRILLVCRHHHGFQAWARARRLGDEPCGCLHIPFHRYGVEVIISEFANLLVWLLLVTLFFLLAFHTFFFFLTHVIRGRKFLMPFHFSILTQKPLFLYIVFQHSLTSLLLIKLRVCFLLPK